MISGGCILNMIITCVAEEDDEEPDALNDIVSRMRDLASNRGDAQRRSKKDRAYLKQTFREHYKAVEVIAPFSSPPLPPRGVATMTSSARFSQEVDKRTITSSGMYHGLFDLGMSSQLPLPYPSKHPPSLFSDTLSAG